MLALNSDYIKSDGDPEPQLKLTANAGFTHIHWVHHWRSDFLYSEYEIDQIAWWLKTYGLKLNDLHGSDGLEKSWVSAREYERLAGVELVKNRINMTARLGGNVVVMHIYAEPEPPEANQIFWSQLQRSLDALEPYANWHGVRLAIENLTRVDNFDTIEKLFARYSPDFLGLCYDSGHANIGQKRMHRLEPLKERLLAIHLHDNDGHTDQHKIPFSATIDWPQLTALIAASAYTKPLTLEVMIQYTGLEDEQLFLQQAHKAGIRLNQMVEDQRLNKLLES